MYNRKQMQWLQLPAAFNDTKTSHKCTSDKVWSTNMIIIINKNLKQIDQNHYKLQADAKNYQ